MPVVRLATRKLPGSIFTRIYCGLPDLTGVFLPYRHMRPGGEDQPFFAFE